LLNWVKETIAEYEVPVHDFKESFSDGRVLLALLHRYDSTFVDFESVDGSKKSENVTQAFTTAEEKISIPQLLDAATVASGHADERSMVLYVSLIQNAFAAKARAGELESTKTGFSSKMTELKAQLEASESEKAEFASKNESLQKQIDELKAKLQEQIDLNEQLRKKSTFKNYLSYSDNIQKKAEPTMRTPELFFFFFFLSCAMRSSSDYCLVDPCRC
jgi:vacuolar-type H+-ATPase subunit I/STV1